MSTAARYFVKVLVQLRVDGRFLDIYALSFYWIMSVHFIACLHLMPGLLVSQFEEKDVYAWFQSPHYQDASYTSKYIMCLSKAVRSIMGVGFIESLKNTQMFDMIFSSIVTVCGRIAIFITLAYMFEIIQGIMSSSLRYDELMVELEQYTKHHNLPERTKEKLKDTYDFKFNKRFFNEKEILSTVSASLRQQILVHNTKDLVENSPFFRDLPASLTLKIISALTVELYLKDDVVFSTMKTGLSVFFITSGSVAYFSPSGKEICHFSDGDYFGEIMLIMDEKQQYSKAIALETTECYR
jgi:hypothetical protein